MDKGSDMVVDDEDDEWVKKMESELLEFDSASTLGAMQKSKKSQQDQNTELAMHFPEEVLMNILAFGRVGRVCKAWTAAADKLARRRMNDSLLKVLYRNVEDDRIEAVPTIAREIELGLFRFAHETISRAYHRKARQLLFNLKDKRNSGLRDRIFSRELPPELFVRMSASEMANPELTLQREKWCKKRKLEVTLDDSAVFAGMTETNRFKCATCNSTRTRYRQWRRKTIVDRVRIIIHCLECPNHWEL